MTSHKAELLAVETSEAGRLNGKGVVSPGRAPAPREPAPRPDARPAPAAAPSTRLGLEDWFGPHGLDDFADNVLGHRPLCTGPRPDLAARLADAFGLHSAEDVLALRDAEMYAWFPTLDGGTTSAPIAGRTAPQFYAGGTTIYVRNIAAFAGHEREMAAAFDIPRSSVHAQLYCNRPGAVTTMHFDPSSVITVQLSGRKTWRLAPNHFAPSPLDGWAPGKPVHPGLRAYTRDVPPAEMPADAVTYELEPGAVLHVPHGYWHETISDQNSLSVHFIIHTPARIQAMLAVLRNELMRDERWRRPARRFDAPDSAERLAGDYAALRDLVSRLDPRDVVRAPVPASPAEDGAPFVRCGQAALGVDEIDGPAAQVTITAYGFGDTETTSLKVGAELLPACRWIGDLPIGTAFAPSDLPGLSTPDARSLLPLLERARLIRRAAGHEAIEA
ncbi:JmjC domain-containing protein [Spirillospora sp. NPDC048911]|uniref:JmjC domain-containing protein n=1 Tax=Spirillospora sp. NPDC048911 TaxID=3364527 RepID=UPI003711F4A9